MEILLNVWVRIVICDTHFMQVSAGLRVAWNVRKVCVCVSVCMCFVKSVNST